MLKVYRQVLAEKKEALESLELKMRTYARADRLAREQVREISSLLQDVVGVLLVILDGNGSVSGNKEGEEVGLTKT